jgi:NAD+ kinase
MTELAQPQRIGLCYNPVVQGARTLAHALEHQCRDAGREAWLAPLPDPVEGDTDGFGENVANSDLLVCVGGDGTVLHASEHAAPGGTPIFGVRMGRLGFLSEVTGEEATDGFASVLQGGGRIERRSTVQARVNSDDPVYALNDVVIGRSTLGRTVSVGARVDGVLIAEYRADAIVLATATGSTGYSLSVGGPILEPTSAELIIVPVAPHLTHSNALVLPPTSEVHLYVERGYEAVITVDGLHERPLDAGSTVVVSHSDRVVDFVRLGSPSQFYSNLADRLGWLRADHVLDQSEQ